MKKYEREIRELLDKLDTFVPENPTPDKERSREREREPERETRKRPVGVMPPQPVPIRPRLSPYTRFRRWLETSRVSVSLQFMVGGLLILALALMVLEFGGGSMLWLAQLIGAIGGLVFLWPIGARFFTGQDLDEHTQDNWRGQPTGGKRGFKFSRWFRGNKSKNPNDWNDRNRKPR